MTHVRHLGRENASLSDAKLLDVGRETNYNGGTGVFGGIDRRDVMMLFVLSAIFMAVTAFLHTYFGEKRLLGPLFASQTPFFEPYPRRRMLRTSWHYQSVFMLSNALVILWPGVDARLKMAIGAFWLVMGLQSLIRSRGKHVGVIPLLGAGITAIAGAVL